MFSPSSPLRFQSSVRKAIKTVLRVSYLSIKVSAWIKGADIWDIISDDVVLKNGSHRKSGLITEISSLPTALLTLYYLEQAMVSVQPKCSHPQTTHQISFYFIRKTWTLIWISAGVCSVGGKPLQTWFLWLCSKNLPRSTRFRESRSRSSVNPVDSSRSSSPAVLCICIRRSSLSFVLLFPHLVLPSQARQGDEEPCQASAVSLTSEASTSKRTRWLHIRSQLSAFGTIPMSLLTSSPEMAARELRCVQPAQFKLHWLILASKSCQHFQAWVPSFPPCQPSLQNSLL